MRKINNICDICGVETKNIYAKDEIKKEFRYRWIYWSNSVKRQTHYICKNCIEKVDNINQENKETHTKNMWIFGIVFIIVIIVIIVVASQGN